MFYRDKHHTNIKGIATAKSINITGRIQLCIERVIDDEPRDYWVDLDRLERIEKEQIGFTSEDK